MKIEGLAFPDAVRELADRAGVPFAAKEKCAMTRRGKIQGTPWG